MINVQFYGVLQEIAGAKEISTPLAKPLPLADVLQQLLTDLPSLEKHLPRLACAVDDEIVPRSHIIHPGATLALLPPVSGGTQSNEKGALHV